MRTHLPWFVLAVWLLLQGGSSPAHAQESPEDIPYSALLVGLPILDGAVFIGGLTAALSAEVQLADERPSLGWQRANLVFAGLNAASSVGYITAMASVRGSWPYLLWPLLAHAGLSVANGVQGYRLRRAAAAGERRSVAQRSPPRSDPGAVQLSPLLAWSQREGTVVGLSAQLRWF